ncbi:RidA family protein [Chelativorans sp. J32]|uniref:RidA family protein n=1 Tax=Chelativorans sp. J32 TaxID=935840 RepID=UPI000480957C|nr:RidA family protein [Chelativorans sp. J32]
MNTILQPKGWMKPRGYSNGIAAQGRLIFIGGQVGWNENCEFESDDIAEQIGKALSNVAAVLAEAGGKPEHITSMTWYFTDKAEYLANLKKIGSFYREVMGWHYPTMAAVEVSALMEDRAKVEIQAMAVIPE